jgi:hypothetical protein
MVYNPNPPFTPSDYGNRTGGIDQAALQQSLEDTRKAIAELGSDPIVSDAKTNVASLLERQPTERSYDTPIKDRDVDSYRKSDWTVSQGIQDQMDKNVEFVNMYRQSLQGVPEEYMEETKPEKNKKDKDKDKKKEGLKLPGLEGEGKAYTFDLYGAEQEVPMQAPDDFKKNPAFDGYKGPEGFQTFLSKVKNEEELAEGMHQGKKNLYDALVDAGLSEDEMYKGAQYAGITNLRTDADSISKDVAAIKDAVENNYYQGTVTEGGGLKSEKDLFKEFKELGGKGNLQEFKDAQKYKSYDNEKDAQKFADYLSDQLTSQGIYQGQSGFDKAQDVFGKKFSMSEYNAALDYKNQDAEYISNYLKDYIEKGGKVGSKVQALITPGNVQAMTTPQGVMGPQTQLQTVFPTSLTNQQPMGPFQYSFGY